MDRRNFIGKTMALGAASMVTPSIKAYSGISSSPQIRPDDIAIAQLALVQELRDGKWKNIFTGLHEDDHKVGSVKTEGVGSLLFKPLDDELLISEIQKIFAR